MFGSILGRGPISFMVRTVADPWRFMEILAENGKRLGEVSDEHRKTRSGSPHPEYALRTRFYHPDRTAMFDYGFEWSVSTVPSERCVVSSCFRLYLESEVIERSCEKMCLTRNPDEAGRDFMRLTYALASAPLIHQILEAVLIGLLQAPETDFAVLPESLEKHLFMEWRQAANPKANLPEAERHGVQIPAEYGWRLVRTLVQHAALATKV